MSSTHNDLLPPAHPALRILAACLVLVPACCLAPFAVNQLQVLWANLVAPWPLVLRIPVPEYVAELPDRTSYSLEWSPSADEITVLLSNWTSISPDAPSTVARVTLASRQVSYSEEPRNTADADSPQLFVPEGFAPEQSVYAECPESDTYALAYGFEGETYFLQVKEPDAAPRTFQFSSDQWPVDYLTPWPLLSFSPSCGRLTLTLGGWVYYEGEGRQELWGLDIPSHQFQRLLVGRSTFFGLWDYPVEPVRPSWSPSSTQLAFGGGEFGLELFDFHTNRRKQLLAPRFNANEPIWSPTGSWIAALRYGTPKDTLLAVSPDGSILHTAAICDLITLSTWSPKDDRLAYICTDDGKESLSILDLR